MAKEKVKGKAKSEKSLYQEYLSTLSSSEIEGIKIDKARALPGFRKFVQNLPEERLLKLMQ